MGCQALILAGGAGLVLLAAFGLQVEGFQVGRLVGEAAALPCDGRKRALRDSFALVPSCRQVCGPRRSTRGGRELVPTRPPERDHRRVEGIAELIADQMGSGRSAGGSVACYVS